MINRKFAAALILSGLTLLSGCGANGADNTENVTSLSESISAAENISSDTLATDLTDASETAATAETTPAAETAEVSEQTDQLTELSNMIAESGNPAGIAYIGYVGYEMTEDDIRSFVKNSPYEELYPFLSSVPLVNAGGAELYAIITVEKDCRTSVFSADINDSGELEVFTDSSLYECKGENCFLLYCNPSEIYSNVLVSFKTADSAFSLSPMLSGMDGRLHIEEQCFDFSVYGDTYTDDVDAAYGTLLERDEIIDRLDQGMVLLYTGETQVIDGKECMLFSVGTDNEEHFVSEYYYAVCDNMVYYYDAIKDEWGELGMG